MSGVFATAGTGDVRVWCLETCQELLRIVVPNFKCSTVLFSGDGKSIVSGILAPSARGATDSRLQIPWWQSGKVARRFTGDCAVSPGKSDGHDIQVTCSGVGVRHFKESAHTGPP